jgi:ABC-2 type transport system ATP-binding protein
VIRLERLTKRYGEKTAVDDVSAVIEPGRVTGFLGPNGAGKSTTMRMIVGLDRPTAGTVTVNGKRYAEHRAPLREVGSLLEARAVHPGRTAANHLRAVAATHGISRARVDEVLGLTGLTAVADKRVGTFSLGMGQRLGMAAALLGDPKTLILDEPVNGLDPEGVLWIRHLTRSLAAEGRTVFLSSHLMSEMAQTADHLIVLGRGRILADAPIADVVAGATQGIVRVRTPDGDRLEQAVTAPGVTVRRHDDGSLEVLGATAAQIGDAALAAGVAVHELTPVNASLEEAYLTLTQDDVEYRETQGAVR